MNRAQQLQYLNGVLLEEMPRYREEARALQLLRGKPAVLGLRTDFLGGAAYHGTGWISWYYEQGSVEERLVESRASGI